MAQGELLNTDGVLHSGEGIQVGDARGIVGHERLGRRDSRPEDLQGLRIPAQAR